jgi:hypothetical protein
MGEEEVRAPPADSNVGKAARLVAEVFGCPVEEATKILVIGIDARIAEQQERWSEQEQG